MVDKNKKSKLPRFVGQFIRERRESLNLSQRALGQRFTPAVTTQFISNVERGVTPLPPAHVPTLAQALQVSEEQVMGLLEKEYAARLSGKLGKPGEGGGNGDHFASMVISNDHHDFIKSLYEAYKKANEDTKIAFHTYCESTLGVPRGNRGSGSWDSGQG